MPSIVQFMHPGPEHVPNNPPANNHINWNTGNHRRKFLCSDGDYVNNGQLFKGNLMFWGEWEPASNIQPLNQNGNPLYPNWIHFPYLPNQIPNATGLQNTDPFVYDIEFKYLLCQQFRHHPLNQTQLAHLDAGSLILFGSAKYPRNPNALFQLDTVFVVADWIVYNPSMQALQPPVISQNYFNIVYSKAYPNNQLNPNLALRLYKGATFNKKINGMYSFSPSQLYDNNNIGFPRISLMNLPPYIVNNLSQGFHITNNLDLNIVQSFWEQIVNISRQNGCIEGVRFY
jgi:hypothetical protein